MNAKAVERRRDVFDWWPELMPRRWLDWFESPTAVFRDEHMLRIEEFVEGKELVVRAEIPGMDPDRDVKVHVRDHTLEIRAEKKQEETKEEGGVHRSEFRYGSFFRAITLPPDAKETDVHATYKNGILEVRMPLEGKQAEATKIEVTRL